METESKETKEELYERLVAPKLPLNECIEIMPDTMHDYQSVNQVDMHSYIANKNKEQATQIKDLIYRVEELTMIINVIAPMVVKYNRRKLN